MKLKNIVLAAALSAGLTPVFAVDVVDWGAHPPTKTQASAVTTQGPFDQIFKFDLAGAFSTAAAAVSIDLSLFNLSVLNISSGTVSLFKNNNDVGNYNDDGAALGSFNFGSSSVTQSFGALQAGDYYYRVTGTATGVSGGAYTLASTVTPVPEPETYALLLAGLGVIGFIARRRRPE